MEYNGEGVEALVALLNEMQNTNLILLDKKVKSLLKLLAYYPEFRSVLEYVNRSFDYESEKKKSLLVVGGRDALRLPRGEKATVALVANLLLEFDCGKTDIISFAAKYFPAETKQASYNEFFQKVLLPFKLALVALVVNGCEDENVPSEGRVVAFAANGIYQQTEYLVVNMVRAVEEAQLSNEERADLLVVLEGFAAALDSRDSLFIKSVWIGLKKLLADKNLCLKERDDVDEQLRLYLVTK